MSEPEEELQNHPPKEDQQTPSPQQEIEQLKESLKEYQDKYLRSLADSENARKRMQKERQEMTKYAVEGILAEFLHPLDNLEKALRFAESMSDEVRNWATGFEMLLNQFKQILSNHGVEEYHSIGKRFDPHLHEAVEMIETTEYEPGVIVEEFVRGYRIGDRPIRVARVKIAKAPEQKSFNNDKQEG